MLRHFCVIRQKLECSFAVAGINLTGLTSILL